MKVQSRCYKTHNARLLHAKQKAEAKNKNNNSFLLCCCWQSHALLLLFFSIELSEGKRRQAKQSQESEQLTVHGYVNLQSSADSVIKATKLTITVEIKAHYYAVNNNNCNLNAKDSDGSCSVSVQQHILFVYAIYIKISSFPYVFAQEALFHFHCHPHWGPLCAAWITHSSVAYARLRTWHVQQRWGSTLHTHTSWVRMCVLYKLYVCAINIVQESYQSTGCALVLGIVTSQNSSLRLELEYVYSHSFTHAHTSKPTFKQTGAWGRSTGYLAVVSCLIIRFIRWMSHTHLRIFKFI